MAKVNKIDSTLLDTYEAAAFLRVAPGTLMNWRNRKQGPPYVRIGHRVRYTLDDLQAWIEKRRVNVS